MSHALPELRTQPFRIVVVDDFVGDGTAPGRTVPVAPSGLDDTLAELGVRLAFSVPNRLGSAPRELRIELRFERLRDFRSSRLTTQVPELRAVVELRERLLDLRAGRTSVAEVERGLDAVRGLDRLRPALELALGAPPPGSDAPSGSAAPPAGADAADSQQQLGRELLDDLLEREPAPPPAPPAGSGSAIDKVIANVAGAAGRTAPAAAAGGVARALELVDELVADQLGAILAAPRLLALERSWRSLQFLLQQAAGDRSPVRVEVCHAVPATFAECFTATVVEPELRGATPTALAMTVLGWPVENRVPELEMLRATWQQAEELQAPLLWSMAGDFLHGDGLAALAGRDSLRPVLEGDELTKWRGARDDGAARWSAACANPFVLRAGDRDDGGGDGDGGDGARALFGMPSYFVAALVLRRVAERGWPAGFAGVRAGSIAGLPVVHGRAVEAPLSEANVADLADAGVLALAAVRGRAEALLCHAPSSHAPAQFGNRDQKNADSRMRSTLAYQLVAARIAETTLAHRSELAGDADAALADDDVQQRFAAFFAALLSDTGPGAAVDVRVEREPSGDRVVLCAVRVGDAVLAGAVVEFALPLAPPRG